MSAQTEIPFLKIYTLGRFEIYRGEERIDEALGKWSKAKNILVLLLLAPNHRLLKEKVLEWLWPEQSPERSSNNLHRTLFMLRRILQPDLEKAADSHYIRFEENSLILNRDAVALIDFIEFEKLIHAGHQQGDHGLPYCEAAYTLYQGEFLPDSLYDEWTVDKRNKLESSYLQLIKHLARTYKKRFDYTKAIEFYQILADLEPIDEEIHRELMRLYTQVGQRHHALQLYKKLCQALLNHFHTEPSPETTIVYEAILHNRLHVTTVEPVSPYVSSAAPFSVTIRPTSIIGREAETQRLEELIVQAKQRQGTVVVVEGEAGIGKTCLVEAAAKQAQALGFRVIFGRIYEQEGSLPYSPFIEMIRECLTPSLQAYLANQHKFLFQNLAHLLPELGTIPASNPFTAEMGQERQHLFDAATLVFTKLASETPLFVVLEDLHLAGESSLQLTHYLARHIKQVPILLVCTLREEAIQRGQPISRFYFDLRSEQLGERLQLQRFTLDDTATIGASLLGRAMSPELCQAIYQLTEGNPFFIHELVLALIENKRIVLQDEIWQLDTSAEIPIPANIQVLIGLRLERLSPEAHQLIEVAAVIGEAFEHELLQLVTDWHNEKILGLVDHLISGAIIKEEGEGYRFNHALVQQFIYNHMTTKRRAWTHEKIARVLEDFYPQQRIEQIAILAFHYECAQCYTKAFHYLVKAGDGAQAAHASQEALGYYNRAITLSHKHLEQDLPEILPNLLERRVQSYLGLSDFEAAIVDLEQLLKIHRQTNAQANEGEALYQLSIAHYWAHRLGKASVFLEQTVELAQAHQFKELLAKAFRLRDILNSTQGRMDNPVEIENTSQALTIEEHWGRAMLAHLYGNFPVAVYHAQSCVKLGAGLLNNFLILGGHFVLGMSYGNLGNYQLALTSLTQAIQLSEMIGDRFWRARLLNTIGWIYRELFDLENAICYDLASLELARTNLPRLTEAEGNALANLAEDYYLTGDYDQAYTYVKEGLTASNEPFMRWRYHNRMVIIQGFLELEKGNLNTALEMADQALGIAHQTQVRKNIARSCRLRGHVLTASGEVGQARKSLTHALEVGKLLNSPSLIWPYYLDLAHFEESQGKTKMAEKYYQQSLENLQQILNQITEPNLSRSFVKSKLVQQVLSKIKA